MFGLEAALGEISSLSPTAIAIMMGVGVVVGLSPGSLPLIAACSTLMVPGASDAPSVDRWKSLRVALAFVLGIALVDATLGALFGAFGFLVLRLLAEVMTYAYLLLGILLFILALALLRLVRFDFRLVSAPSAGRSGVPSALYLGLAFGLTTCPACTPLILPVLMAAAGSADPAMGGVLLFVFGLARGVPIIVLGGSATLLQKVVARKRVVRSVEKAVGIVLLIASGMLLYQAGIYAGLFAPI